MSQRELGGLVITPGQGQDISVVQMHTAAGCPKEADAYYAVMKGKGLPADGQIITATTDVGLSHTEGFDVHLSQTLRDVAADNNSTLQGGYEVKVRCIDAFSQNSFGEFTAQLNFGTPTAYAALGPAKGPDRIPDTQPPVAEVPPPPTAAAPPPSASATVDSPAPAAAIQPAPAATDSGLLPMLIIIGFIVAVIAVIVTTAKLRKRGSSDA